MKNYRNLIKAIGGLLLGSTVMVSCMKDSSPSMQAIGDIIIQDMKTEGGGVKYGLVVYVTANFEILSGKVTAPGTGGKVYQLTPVEGNKYQCVYYPAESDYTAEMPVKGDYAMEIISASGETLYGNDIVGDEKLAPIVIKSAEVAAGIAKITWDKVTDADAYVVRLYSADKSKILFTTDYLGSDAIDYNLSSSSTGWATGVSPAVGTDYVIGLLAVRVETDVVTSKASNLQFITTDNKTITWQ